MGNMFCGYACVVYAMRGEYETAAPFIGIAIVLDMLDGRIARLTGTASDFGVEFDSLADVISFGIAPAILSFAWGLAPLGRLGWAAGFLFVTAAAMRLARFNIQSAAGGDKRYFVGMPSPAAAGDPGGDRLRVSRAGCTTTARRCRRWRWCSSRRADGQHDPLPQLQDDRPADAAAVHRAAPDRRRHHADRDPPAVVLVVMAYTYLASAFIGHGDHARQAAGRARLVGSRAGAATATASAPAAARLRRELGGRTRPIHDQPPATPTPSSAARDLPNTATAPQGSTMRGTP